MTNEVKNVPELRFPEFDEEWKKKRLKDICKINPKFEDNFPSEFNYIDLESVKKGKIYKISKYTMHNAPSRAQRVAKQGDIFFQTVRPYQQNNFVFVDDSYPTVVSTGYAQLRSNLNPSYLYNLLLTTSFLNKVLVKCTGSNYPAINSSDLSNIQLKVTSNIDEQQKIGEFFSKLDQQIELEEQKLAKLEEQKKGYMQKIFSQELRFKDENGNDYPEWEIKKLMQIAKVKTGSKNVQDNIQDGKFKFFDRSVEVKYLNTFDFDETAIIYPGEGSKFLPRYFSGKYSLHQRAYSIYDININNNYLYYYLSLQNNHFLKYAVGSTVKSLRMSGFDKLKVMVPKNSEQEKIGDFFNELDELIEKQSSKIGVLKQRKKGFLQKMFV